MAAVGFCEGQSTSNTDVPNVRDEKVNFDDRKRMTEMEDAMTSLKVFLTTYIENATSPEAALDATARNSTPPWLTSTERRRIHRKIRHIVVPLRQQCVENMQGPKKHMRWTQAMIGIIDEEFRPLWSIARTVDRDGLNTLPMALEDLGRLVHLQLVGPKNIELITLDPFNDGYGQVPMRVTSSDEEKKVVAEATANPWGSSTFEDGYDFNNLSTEKLITLMVDNREALGQKMFEKGLECGRNADQEKKVTDAVSSWEEAFATGQLEERKEQQAAAHSQSEARDPGAQVAKAQDAEPFSDLNPLSDALRLACLQRAQDLKDQAVVDKNKTRYLAEANARDNAKAAKAAKDLQFQQAARRADLELSGEAERRKASQIRISTPNYQRRPSDVAKEGRNQAQEANARIPPIPVPVSLIGGNKVFEGAGTKDIGTIPKGPLPGELRRPMDERNDPLYVQKCMRKTFQLRSPTKKPEPPIPDDPRRSSSNGSTSSSRSSRGAKKKKRLHRRSQRRSSPTSSRDGSSSRGGGHRRRSQRSSPSPYTAEEILMRDASYYLSLPKPWNVVPDKKKGKNTPEFTKFLTSGNLSRFDCTKASWARFRDTFILFVHRVLMPKEEKLLVLEMSIDNKDVAMNQFFQMSPRGPETYRATIEMLEEYYGAAAGHLEENLRVLENLPTVPEFDCLKMRQLTGAIQSYIISCKLQGLAVGHSTFRAVFKKLSSNQRGKFSEKLEQGFCSATLEDLRTFCKKVERAWNTLDDFEPATTRRPTAPASRGPRVTHHGGEFPDEQLDIESLQDQFEEFGVNNDHVCRLSAEEDPCFLCRQPHLLRECAAFLKLNPRERLQKLAEDKRCFRCLRKGHGKTSCPSTLKCKECKEDHNSLLHGASPVRAAGRFKDSGQPPKRSTDFRKPKPSTQFKSCTREEEDQADEEETTGDKEESQSQSNKADGEVKSHPSLQAELPIAPVLLTDLTGKRKIRVNALLDSGSTATLMSERVADFLQLEGPTKLVTVHLACGRSEQIKQRLCRTRIVPLMGEPKIAHVRVMKQACGNLMPTDWNEEKKRFHHLERIQFPDIDVTQEVELILGTTEQRLMRHLCVDIAGGDEEPVAALTPMGWTAAGPMPTPDQEDRSALCMNTTHFNRMSCSRETEMMLNRGGGVPPDRCAIARSCLDKLTQNILEDWEPDLIKEEEDYALSKDERRCVELLDSKRKFEHGRYWMPVLWREGEPDLPYNRNYALSRMNRNEVMLKKTPGAWEKYNAIIQDHHKKGYIRKIGEGEFGGGKYYLAHFAVIRENRSSTKVRLVFDGKAKALGKSLNDAVSPGPKLINDLPGVLMRFRLWPIALAGDLQEMFLQIHMLPEDCPYHRFVHKQSPDAEVEEWEWQRHCFGNAGSPAVAMATVRIHAEERRDKYPLAAEAALKSSLVDDTLTSYQTVKETLDAYHEWVEMYKEAGMNVRKFISNSSEVLDQIPEESREPKADFRTISAGGEVDAGDASAKTLGIRFYPATDDFQFKLELPEELTADIQEKGWTKRKYLVVYSRLYDPLGLLAAFTIIPRLIFQRLWREGFDWDERLPKQEVWEEWYKSATEELQELRINRCLAPCQSELSEEVQLEIHCFVDASSEALGVAVYLKMTQGEHVTVNLIAGKSKLAQLKAVSVPRLELSAADLGVKLTRIIKEALGVERVFYWTDSTCVLHWFRLEHRRMQAYVANRVHRILLHTDRDQWRYVNTKQNPADMPTRGLLAKDLKSNSLWWHGPEFLVTGEVPEQPDFTPSQESEKELRKTFKELQFHAMGVPNVSEPSDQIKLADLHLDKTDWRKLVRSLCDTGGENVSYRESERRIILSVQIEAWPKVMEQLRANGRVRPGHQLANLNPQPDKHGILRVCARLRLRKDMKLDAKCPMLLPKDSQITGLIVRDVHENALSHGGGAGTLLAEVQTRYWIPGGRALIKRILRNCLRCVYRQAKPMLAAEAPLPMFRAPVQKRVAAFEDTGVDAAGPWLIAKGRATTKKWIVVFVCMNYGCTHIETICELSTQSFLQAFQRFTARRCTPKRIFSDNGTNFQGAAKCLKGQPLNDIMEAFEQKHPTIEWSFNSPLSPHQGGMWERQVGMLKTTLRRIMTADNINANKLHDEDFTTLVTVAEGIINLRPLGYISTDGVDLQPLTPAHFLCGEKFSDFLFPETLNRGGKRLYGQKFLHVQDLLQSFWERYIKEVVPQMNKLNRKWLGNKASLEEGDVVVVFEDSLRGRYPLGRVTELIRHQGDNIARQAIVLVNGKSYRRSLSRLSLLLHADEIPNADCTDLPPIPDMPEEEEEGGKASTMPEELPPRKPPPEKPSRKKKAATVKEAVKKKKKPATTEMPLRRSSRNKKEDAEPVSTKQKVLPRRSLRGQN